MRCSVRIALFIAPAATALLLLQASAGVAGPPPGMGFGGPPGGGTRKVLDQFDKDGKGWLNAAERKKAREYLAANPGGGRGFRGGFGRGGGQGGGAAGSEVAPKV